MAFSFKGVFLFSEEAQSLQIEEESVVTCISLLLFRVSCFHLRTVLDRNQEIKFSFTYNNSHFLRD